MSILRLLHDLDAVAHIAMNRIISWLAFVAVRRTRLLFFRLIFAGTLLGACPSFMLLRHRYAFRPEHQLFYVIYRSGVRWARVIGHRAFPVDSARPGFAHQRV